MDKLNMTQTPWTLDDTFKQDGNISLMGADKMHIGNLFQGMSRVNKTHENAEAIVKAVNGTYGVGINPEAVKGLYDTLLAIFNSQRGKGLSVELVIKTFESLDKATPGILTNP